MNRPGCLSYLCIAIGLLTIGYVAGTNNFMTPQTVQAEDKKEGTGLPENVEEKIKLALEALEQAKGSLEGEGLYKSATTEINSLAITSGGVDAIADLERGNGVDPETFAALYAGKHIDEIAEHMGKDDKGRLTYKGKVVRMYPLSRLKKMLDMRSKLSGKEDLEEGDDF